MKLVVLIGPQAVGKMTIGHELEKITKLKLFHNHMSIDLVNNFFNYGTPEGQSLVRSIREQIFDSVASSDLDGLIYTFVWYFDKNEDREYLESLVDIFRRKNAEIIYVELEADKEERLIRNRTDHRLKHKPSKRDVEWSENDINNSLLKHRVNSEVGEITEKNYLKINNTNIEASDVAELIKQKFNL